MQLLFGYRLISYPIMTSQWFLLKVRTLLYCLNISFLRGKKQRYNHLKCRQIVLFWHQFTVSGPHTFLVSKVSSFQQLFIGKYRYKIIQQISVLTKGKIIYKPPLVSGPHCYAVHADSYPIIEMPKKHVAKGRLFPLGSRTANKTSLCHMLFIPYV